MKDARHHLRKVQQKVVQDSKRAALLEEEQSYGYESEISLEGYAVVEADLDRDDAWNRETRAARTISVRRHCH